MTLRDVMTQEEHAVTERSASRGMEPGDLLFGQLASVDRLTMLEASNGFAIPPMEKAPIIELRAHIASPHPVITHQVLRDWDFELLALFHEIADRLYNPRLPTLQNTDGEPLLLHKLVFELSVPPQAAFDALKHLALDELDEDLLGDATRDSEDKLTRVRFSWTKHGNKKHAGWGNTVLGWIEIDGMCLIAEANSEARADAIRKKIETALGERHSLSCERNPIAGEDACRPAGGRRRTRWRCLRGVRTARRTSRGARKNFRIDGGALGALDGSAAPHTRKPHADGCCQGSGRTRDRRVARHSGRTVRPQPDFVNGRGCVPAVA